MLTQKPKALSCEAFSIALLLALSICLVSCSSEGSSLSTISNPVEKPRTWKASFVQQLKDIHSRQPPYVMDEKIKPDNPIEKGVDCSRFMYLAARRAGAQISRVTSKDMAYGRGGWIGYDLVDKLRDSDEADLSFWTWRGSKREFGHVGCILVGTKSGLLEVLHASSSRHTTVIQPLEGVFVRDLAKVRRLTIGDPVQK
jgi:cell wall-associated NlpC family hydrolase